MNWSDVDKALYEFVRFLFVQLSDGGIADNLGPEVKNLNIHTSLFDIVVSFVYGQSVRIALKAFFCILATTNSIIQYGCMIIKKQEAHLKIYY